MEWTVLCDRVGWVAFMDHEGQQENPAVQDHRCGHFSAAVQRALHSEGISYAGIIDLDDLEGLSGYRLSVLEPLVAIVGLGFEQKETDRTSDRRVGSDGGSESALRIRGSSDDQRERGGEMLHVFGFAQ